MSFSFTFLHTLSFFLWILVGFGVMVLWQLRQPLETEQRFPDLVIKNLESGNKIIWNGSEYIERATTGYTATTEPLRDYNEAYTATIPLSFPEEKKETEYITAIVFPNDAREILRHNSDGHLLAQESADEMKSEWDFDSPHTTVDFKIGGLGLKLPLQPQSVTEGIFMRAFAGNRIFLDEAILENETVKNAWLEIDYSGQKIKFLHGKREMEFPNEKLTLYMRHDPTAKTSKLTVKQGDNKRLVFTIPEFISDKIVKEFPIPEIISDTETFKKATKR